MITPSYVYAKSKFRVGVFSEGFCSKGFFFKIREVGHEITVPTGSKYRAYAKIVFF